MIAAVAVGCRKHREAAAVEDRDEETDEASEQESQARPNYWRVQIEVVGRGIVVSRAGELACAPDGGACGPRLFAFDELAPPLLHAVPDAGWQLARWQAAIRAPDGSTHARATPMPDGAYYLDGFGYADTGELEAVTAVFVRAAP